MIASVGDASIDYYVTTGEKHVGGIATNFAVHGKRLDEFVVLMTAIGDDEDARLFLKQMEMEGVATTYVKQLSGPTSEQRIRLVGKERNFVGFFAGVLAEFQLSDDDLGVIRKSDAVVTPLTDGLKSVFEQVMNADLGGKTLKVADFSRDADIEGFMHGDVAAMVFHYMDQLDIAFVGGDESMVETISSMAEVNPDKMLILTLGPKGSITYYKGNVYRQKAYWIKNVVDTTGCGDAFRAGFVIQYLRNNDIPAALDAAARLAADAATHFGAF